MSKVTSASESKYNRSRIFNYIYRETTTSKRDIADYLRLSIPTVSSCIKGLAEENLIRESGIMDSTGGRKPMAISVNPSRYHSIGLSIRPDFITAVLLDFCGSVLLSDRIARPFENTSDYMFQLGNMVQRIASRSGVQESSILGVGIALPGTLSADSRVLVFSHVLPTSLLSSDFGQNIPFPVIFCNDANAAGLSEIWNTQSQTINNAVYLAINDTVGGSIILDNSIYQGDNFRSGEFGHIPILKNGRPCRCGQKGCLGAYCNTTELSSLTGGDLNLFFKELDAGNAQAENRWHEYTEYLCTGINILRSIFDCDIIIGGELNEFIGAHIADIRQLVAVHNPFENNGNYVKNGKGGVNSSAIGSGLMFIKKFIENI